MVVCLKGGGLMGKAISDLWHGNIAPKSDSQFNNSHKFTCSITENSV